MAIGRRSSRARRAFFCLLAGGVPLLGASPATARDLAAAEALSSWVALDVPTGYESRVAPALARRMDGWAADRWGNLVRKVGSGSPRRVLACALDEPALVASQVTADGYLRVHRIGRRPPHPLWDQQFAYQPVRVIGRDGPVAGVVAGTNAHFSSQHRDETAVLSADDLWVDVGAESRADVEALGIKLLDPIVRDLPPWPLYSGVAGPAAGRRAGCAVVAALAAAGAAAGETTFVLSAQGDLGWIGLTSHLSRNPPPDELVMLTSGTAQRGRDIRDTSQGAGMRNDALRAVGLEAVTVMSPEVMHPGSHLEFISVDEAEQLFADVALASGLPALAPRWVPAPGREEPRRPRAADRDFGTVAAILTDLVELHGIPGHEWAVRRYVLEALPDWARRRAVVDDIGNVVVEAGPAGDPTVFMAHMDEVGYTVTDIAQDGIVTLQQSGGPATLAWEGQTALLHFDPADAPSTRTGTGRTLDARFKRQSLEAAAPEPLRGVFLIRAEPIERTPADELRAWFGMNASELRQRGVTNGAWVTSFKKAHRLGARRFAARALDDRAGTTALIRAAHAIDPDALPGRIVFAWSVHEEGGLIGAAALAERFGATTQRIYSVDTFVSSDTPLESPHFAFAPLGAGPVLRAIESSGVSPDAERDRVFAAAARAGIPLQIGLTQGATDGTTFTYRGAPNQGLSWPGRYSHSPGEVLDLRDLDQLVALIVELARSAEP